MLRLLPAMHARMQVPNFTIAGHVVVPGAAEPEVFQQAIRKALSSC